MDNELLLQSNNDIPFVEAQVTIHQPSLNEISLIGEENFFAGCHLLNFSKDLINSEDKSDLSDKDDFDILMSMINGREINKYKNSALMVLTLLFPEYMIKITDNAILLCNKTNSARITKENFNAFKDILDSMFCLKDEDMGSSKYNPADRRAEKIVEKLKKSKEKIAHSKGQDGPQKVAVFSRYVSILSVGLQKSKEDLMKYTVFQIKDEFQRFQMKQSWDAYISARLAGAENLDEVDNWMEDIHP